MARHSAIPRVTTATLVWISALPCCSDEPDALKQPADAQEPGSCSEVQSATKGLELLQRDGKREVWELRSGPIDSGCLRRDTTLRFMLSGLRNGTYATGRWTLDATVCNQCDVPMKAVWRGPPPVETADGALRGILLTLGATDAAGVEWADCVIPSDPDLCGTGIDISQTHELAVAPEKELTFRASQIDVLYPLFDDWRREFSEYEGSSTFDARLGFRLYIYLPTIIEPGEEVPGGYPSPLEMACRKAGFSTMDESCGFKIPEAEVEQAVLPAYEVDIRLPEIFLSRLGGGG